ARLLVCHTNCEPREIEDELTSDGIDEEVVRSYGELVKELITTWRLRPEPVSINASADAFDAFKDHYNAIVRRWNGGELRDVPSLACRWTEQAWRIAVCLHAGMYGAKAGDHDLSVATANNAIEIADWFAEQQLRILDAGRDVARNAKTEKVKSMLKQTPTIT